MQITPPRTKSETSSSLGLGRCGRALHWDGRCKMFVSCDASILIGCAGCLSGMVVACCAYSEAHLVSHVV